MDEGRDWPRLANAVKQRRLELGLSARAAAASAGINRATWSSIEDGDRRLSRHLWSGVDRALRWEVGSVERVLAGGDPVLARASPRPREILPSDFDLEAELARVDRLDIPAQTKLLIIRRLLELHEQAQAEGPPRTTNGNNRAS